MYNRQGLSFWSSIIIMCMREIAQDYNITKIEIPFEHTCDVIKMFCSGAGMNWNQTWVSILSGNYCSIITRHLPITQQRILGWIRNMSRHLESRRYPDLPIFDWNAFWRHQIHFEESYDVIKYLLNKQMTSSNTFWRLSNKHVTSLIPESRSDLDTSSSFSSPTDRESFA